MIEIVSPNEGPCLARSLFLAGGITDCPDWQKDAVAALKDTDLVLFNPRRREFDITDTSASDVQIEWEHRHLQRADAILFWFPEETMCPITLFELGVWGNSMKRIFVGTHPNYARAFDVRKQLSLMRPAVQVVDNFDALMSQTINWWARCPAYKVNK